MADDKAPASQGGPGPEPQPSPEGGVEVSRTVKIKMAGKEFDVAPDLAGAYEDRERDFQKKMSANSEELGSLRRFKQDADAYLMRQPAPQAPAQGPNLNVLWYENPEAAAKIVEERVATRLRGEYLQTEALKEFWTGFYRANQDLQEDDFFVKAVFSKIGRAHV